MLRARLLTAIALIPIVVWLIYLGDLPFLALILAATTLAEIEFCLLVAGRRFRAIHLFGIVLLWLFVLDGRFPGWGILRTGLALTLIASLAWRLADYRRTRTADWTGTVASGVYIGVCAWHLIRLRDLPQDGRWWTFIIVPAILLADSAAYLVGSQWGKLKLARSVSAGKTWEGYLAGVLVGGLASALLGWLWSFKTGPGSAITVIRGLVVGTLVAALAPVGDLAISTVKREAGVQDSGRLLPGHGGVLDRLDSVMWAGVIGYACITWFLI
ncbi:MAG: CDP-archaeol synthase [Anaerolineae bacterium]